MDMAILNYDVKMINETVVHLANVLRTHRQRSKLSLRSQATLFGVSVSTLSRLDRGMCIPDLSSLVRIHHRTGLSWSALLGGI